MPSDAHIRLQFPENHCPISVNLPANSFHTELIEHISQTLQETSLDACSLKLEITESAIMENFESATAMLLQLRDLEVELHMDDFGTGYSP